MLEEKKFCLVGVARPKAGVIAFCLFCSHPEIKVRSEIGFLSEYFQGVKFCAEGENCPEDKTELTQAGWIVANPPHPGHKIFEAPPSIRAKASHHRHSLYPTSLPPESDMNID